MGTLQRLESPTPAKRLLPASVKFDRVPRLELHELYLPC